MYACAAYDTYIIHVCIFSVDHVRKYDYYIHDMNNISDYQNIMCKTILKSGPKKGQECGAHCKIGYFTCKRHSK